MDIGFFVTVLVLAILLGMVARLTLTGNQDVREAIEQNQTPDTLSDGSDSQSQQPHLHVL